MKRKKTAPFAYDAPGDTPESLARALEQADSLTGAPGRDGLLAMAYYRGWGVEADAERAFCHARQGMQAGDGAACYVLALMCANGDTPDQRTGGPRQEYDHYDAEHFMQMAADGREGRRAVGREGPFVAGRLLHGLVPRRGSGRGAGALSGRGRPGREAGRRKIASKQTKNPGKHRLRKQLKTSCLSGTREFSGLLA